MLNQAVYDTAMERFRSHFGCDPTAAAYAPGRIEVLGNHTDYNEGFVLSAAIDLGTFFLAAPSGCTSCRLVAGDLMAEATFDTEKPVPSAGDRWPNYVEGVVAGLQKHGPMPSGFLGLFLGNVPLGAGLSSSAALEMAAGLALGALYGITVDRLELAKIGQTAEHEYVGAKCGLLDQITSLFGREGRLVMTDFRSLEVESVPVAGAGGAPSDQAACFLMCNTHTQHSLVESEYNERRSRCEQAASAFAAMLNRPVRALRDVSWREWEKHAGGMEDVTARRAAHVIGENTRVQAAREALDQGRLGEFGKLMFESHMSSRKYFENSCKELDFLVDTAARVPGVLGARLSGGGFGGSMVLLLHPRDVEHVGAALSSAFNKAFGRPCDVRVVLPSRGARVLTDQSGDTSS